jgi:hypothetical protein
MQTSPSSSLPPQPQPQPLLSHSSATLVCQWCSQTGHSARDCPF